MDPVQEYLNSLHEIRSTGGGVDETSYYGALERLLTEVGHNLKPRVRCVLQLANRGAGSPDGGLYTASQFQRTNDRQPESGQLPERGAIEVKPASDDAWVTADGGQVAKYWKRYGLVLVTNYRDFVVVGTDDEGEARKYETFRLAESEREFWDLAGHPGRLRRELAARFAEFLVRVMRHKAPLSKPEDVAWFLASYARDARERIEGPENANALAEFRAALEETLGMKFEGEDDEKLFKSSSIQTLFYGVFAAWVLWAHEKENRHRTAKFDWKQAGWTLHVPMIRALYEQVSGPLKLKSLNLVEPLDWTSEVLNRVNVGEFFSAFDQGLAVQYFYEPFLEQFDPELRKRYGVWYTPPEIVKYMVARVDTVLREELGIEDGLADSRVQILDPCCGTGAYLVEVLRKIDETLKARGNDALAAQDIKQAAMTRVFGFEIMPAPFVVAHMQIGLLLRTLGAPLSQNGEDERAQVYLTNALTDWEPPKDPKKRLQMPMPELEQERDAAGRIKRTAPILVVLGNPPYNAFAGTATTVEERDLIRPYKEGLNTPVDQGGWGIKKFNLDDLYVRFFRLAERRIAELTKEGVVCFISSYSYLDDPSFVVLRGRFVSEYNSIWIDNMNGDSRETGKRTPDGKPDPSVFSTSAHPVGIRVGTAVGLFIKSKGTRRKAPVRYREFWGTEKRVELLDSLDAKWFETAYARVTPTRENRFSFRPASVADHYMEWPKVVDLCAVPPSNGLMEKRGGALIDIDKDSLAKRMKAYLDPKLDWDQFRALDYGLTEKQARFDPKAARDKIQHLEQFSAGRIVRYCIRPFDTRWCYYTGVRPIWNEPRPALWAQCWKGNRFLLTRFKSAKDPEGPPFYFTQNLSDDHLLAPDAVAIPYQLRTPKGTGTSDATDLFHKQKKLVGNLVSNGLSKIGENYLRKVDGGAASTGTIWNHVLAIGYSPAYLSENADGIRQDWPRIPLPASKDPLERSAGFGAQIACLLDTDTPLHAVTSGTIRSELRVIGTISRSDGGNLAPKKGDLDVTVGWGRAGRDGATMPGKGRLVEREYTKDEKDAITIGALEQGLTYAQALAQLGESAVDVYLNDRAYWACVPKNVWDYFIGGYQVVKKWLSYRERSVLGRGLTPDEAREVTNMCRRIAAILLLQPSLDDNYEAVKRDCFDWATLERSSS